MMTGVTNGLHESLISYTQKTFCHIKLEERGIKNLTILYFPFKVNSHWVPAHAILKKMENQSIKILLLH